MYSYERDASTLLALWLILNVYVALSCVKYLNSIRIHLELYDESVFHAKDLMTLTSSYKQPICILSSPFENLLYE